MVREVDGWEHTKNGPRWAPTTGVQVADMLCGLYGSEYDEAKREIDDLIRAVQRDAAEKLRAWAATFSDAALIAQVIREGADLIAPTYPKGD